VHVKTKITGPKKPNKKKIRKVILLMHASLDGFVADSRRNDWIIHDEKFLKMQMTWQATPMLLFMDVLPIK